MGEWQKDPTALLGHNDIVYIVAMTENCQRQPASASELAPWASELAFDAVLVTDPVRQVYNAYASANNCQPSAPGGPGCSNAVTVIIDKTMRVRYFGRTYLCGTGENSRCGEAPNISASTKQCLQGALGEMQKLLAE
ncbi:MAG: hypothetical protein KC503_01075 [Myxococcales bacterium]|nr:hypothetical protein [Myxococcales bacterium]